MGFYGASRIWYLKKFDAYCAEHDRTVFDQETVEGWVSGAAGHLGPLPVVDVLHPRLRPVAAAPTGTPTPTCCPTGGRPRSCPPIPTCSPPRDRCVLRRGGEARDEVAMAVAGGGVLHADALVRDADRRGPRSAGRACRPAGPAHRRDVVQGQTAAAGCRSPATSPMSWPPATTRSTARFGPARAHVLRLRYRQPVTAGSGRR